MWVLYWKGTHMFLHRYFEPAHYLQYVRLVKSPRTKHSDFDKAEEHWITPPSWVRAHEEWKRRKQINAIVELRQETQCMDHIWDPRLITRMIGHGNQVTIVEAHRPPGNKLVVITLFRQKRQYLRALDVHRRIRGFDFAPELVKHGYCGRSRSEVKSAPYAAVIVYEGDATVMSGDEWIQRQKEISSMVVILNELGVQHPFINRENVLVRAGQRDRSLMLTGLFEARLVRNARSQIENKYDALAYRPGML